MKKGDLMQFVRHAGMAPESWEQAGVLAFDPHGRVILEARGHDWVVPVLSPEEMASWSLSEPAFIGFLDDMCCFCARWTGALKSSDNPGSSDNSGFPGKIEPPYKLKNLRSFFLHAKPDYWGLLGYAKQICDLHDLYKFCGRCGTVTRQKEDEQGRVCPSCHQVYYPKISPAIITAVVKEDKLLLARGVNFPDKEMFSVLAGFVEPQETLEDCVRREIFEESGIRVDHIRYFASQPWPFPDSLMIGFTAEYAGGEIQIDEQEIADAGWFSADNLPKIPEKHVLAGMLIRWFIERQQS